MTYAKTLQEAKDGCKECLTVNDCVKEECRWHWIIKALEKQIPKKAEYKIVGNGWNDWIEGKCPVCGADIKNTPIYCPCCGQAISWEGEE